MESRWVKKGKFIGPFSLLATFFIAFFLLSTAVLVVASFWYKTALQPVGGTNGKIFVVKKGDSAKDIAERLESEGLVKNSLAFRIYLLTSNLDEKIEVGSFRLNSDQTAQEIGNELQHGQLDKWVTLVEGLRVEEMAEKLAEEFSINQRKFISQAQEGYMFPDTYLIPINTSEKKLVSVLRKNFDNKVDKNIVNKAKKNGLTLRELIILASIVERESKNGEERPTIAGILLKRLKGGARLEVDATIQYALGYQETEKTWWKKSLTVANIEIDSPYNSRKFPGLPPTPICNPGLSAIEAVASPKSSPYYYYIHDKEGKAHFATTLEEHNANIGKYLR